MHALIHENDLHGKNGACSNEVVDISACTVTESFGLNALPKLLRWTFKNKVNK